MPQETKASIAVANGPQVLKSHATCGNALHVEISRAPRGLDAATLWFGSLRVPELADKVVACRRADLESRDGKLMQLWRCAEFLAWATDEEPEYVAVMGAARRLAGELKG